MDDGFLGEREPEEHVSPVLVIRERRHKMTWAMLVPRKGTEFPWNAKSAARFIDQLGHNRVTLRCDNETAIEALASPVGESQSYGIIELAVELVAGQARTLKAALEYRTGTSKDTVLAGGICCVLDEQVRHQQGRKDTAAKIPWEKGQHTFPGVRRKDPVHARQSKPRFHPEVYGTQTEYSECEPSLCLQMAATMQSTFKSECRDPRRWYPETRERCRWMGSQRRLSLVPVSKNWPGETTSAQ